MDGLFKISTIARLYFVEVFACGEKFLKYVDQSLYHKQAF